MEPVPFIADTANEAIYQINQELGPEAIVVSVRRLPVQGIARLWRNSRVEVIATVPDQQQEKSKLASDREFLVSLDSQSFSIHGSTNRGDNSASMENIFRSLPQSQTSSIQPRKINQESDWQIGALLKNLGVLPLHAETVVETLQSLHGEKAPNSLTDEIALTKSFLTKTWHPPLATRPRELHLFVGCPGVGKSTSLCKWLTQIVLLENRSAVVWRLDSENANTAELVSIHSEILSVPVARSLSQSDLIPDIGFIDIPGVSVDDAAVLNDFLDRLREWGSPQIHLVLNGSYDTEQIFKQIKMFSCLPIDDLIITHLDELSNWGKVWNFVLGTRYPIRYLATGQKIPSDWITASADFVLRKTFPAQ